MLIMTRKIGETIVIGEDVEVTLVQVQLAQGQVRLGIKAPVSRAIYRKELFEAIRKENLLAAEQSADIPSIPSLGKRKEE